MQRPLVLIGVLLCSPVFAADLPSRQQMIAEQMLGVEKLWKSLQKEIPPRLGCRALFDNALVYCEARQYPERLEKLFDLAAQMQDREPSSRTYGNFRWYWNSDRVFDQNAVDFCMQNAVLIWKHHRDWIPEPARAKLKQLMELGTIGCMKHRVAESYTNIALMNAQNLIVLGELMNDKKAADEGYARLDRQCLYVWECGVHEYDSPTYYGLDLDALTIIEAYAQRERGKAQARALLEVFWTDIAANFFWPAGKLAGTRSRDYDYLRGLGVLDHHLWLVGWIPPETLKRAPVYAMQSNWRPSPALKQMSQTKLPRLVRQIWGDQESQHKTHYLLPDVTLGSSGATYHNMDIPLSADLPGPRTGVRCYFIADGRHDPYGRVKIPEGQPGGHEKTLHLRPFFQAAQRLTDAAAIVVYREKDIPEGTQTLESHWVMPLLADSFTVGERHMKLDGKQKVSVELRPGEPVVLRRGTAAVGVRVMWARGMNGAGAPIKFEFDGNAHGAVRVTVEHGKEGEKKDEKSVTVSAMPPAAAFWVRVGSGLKDDAAYETWRKSFASAQGQVQGNEREVDVRLDGTHGKVRVQAGAPYTEAGAYDPPPAKTIVEIDGTDVGRKILENIEPIKTYRMAQNEYAMIPVPAKQGVHFEAEQGAVFPGFAIGEDATASGKKFVWLPGEPGGKGGGNGSVTYRLSIAEAGGYYLWGRVISPTPDDDSFFVRVSAAGKEVLPPTTWPLGVRKDWAWVRFSPGEGREIRPMHLPAGEVKLQIKAREDGAKVDRLFITTAREQKPE